MSQTATRVRNAGRRGSATVIGSIKKLLYIVVATTVLVCLVMFGLFLAALNHMQ